MWGGTEARPAARGGSGGMGHPLFKVARGASVSRRIDIVPEKATQVDGMLIPRSNFALLHKLLSAPERVSGTDRGGPPGLVERKSNFLR